MSTLKPPEKQCPLCHADNQCLAGTDQEAYCWCHDAAISKSSLQGISAQSSNKICICPNCAAANIYPNTSEKA